MSNLMSNKDVGVDDELTMRWFRESMLLNVLLLFLLDTSSKLIWGTTWFWSRPTRVVALFMFLAHIEISYRAFLVAADGTEFPWNSK